MEKRYLISELLEIQNLDPKDVLDSLKFYAEFGLFVHKAGDIESIISRTPFSAEQLKLAYQYLINAAKNEKVRAKPSMFFYEQAAHYIELKLAEMDKQKSG